jgi:phosphocarrier protein HPr
MYKPDIENYHRPLTNERHKGSRVIANTFEIINKLGLHARAASVFVKTASAFSAEITVRGTEKDANGKSIMSMMLLEAAFGSTIEVRIEGDDESAAMTVLATLIENRFGESE